MLKFIVNTNLSKDKVPESFSGELTQQLSKALGKPAQVMSFGGSADLSALCFLYSIGKTGEQENKVYSKLLCDLLNKQLKIPSNRIYSASLTSALAVSAGIAPPSLEVPWGGHSSFLNLTVV